MSNTNAPQKLYPCGIFTTTVPIELVGLELLLSPFPQFITAQRSTMFSSQIWQAENIFGAEKPRIMTGYENNFSEYSFTGSPRKGDAMIFASVPKFTRLLEHAYTNPSTAVIMCIGNEATIEMVEEFTMLTKGYGYNNVKSPEACGMNLTEGTYLAKEIQLTKPPSIKNGNYCQGVEANFVTMTLPQVAEDALVISEDMAEACSTYGFEKYRINIGFNDNAS